VQFGKEFGFDDAAALAPYLAQLGISHLYASPYPQTR
jgi:(1->4)-alpha-D-glucan 1-alpha-D-glucosylmutase